MTPGMLVTLHIVVGGALVAAPIFLLALLLETLDRRGS